MKVKGNDKGKMFQRVRDVVVVKSRSGGGKEMFIITEAFLPPATAQQCC